MLKDGTPDRCHELTFVLSAVFEHGSASQKVRTRIDRSSVLNFAVRVLISGPQRQYSRHKDSRGSASPRFQPHNRRSCSSLPRRSSRSLVGARL
jgi:hypothetical protein